MTSNSGSAIILSSKRWPCRIWEAQSVSIAQCHARAHESTLILNMSRVRFKHVTDQTTIYTHLSP